MINIQRKEDCCGCKACFDICPQKCINMVADAEGFWYPIVNEMSCVNCGLCIKVCPQLHVKELQICRLTNPICYGAVHKNLEIRFKSSAGGVFSALAEEMYKCGGFVGGAVYSKDWKVRHIVSNNPDDLEELRQSKYSQSDTAGFYSTVKSLLQHGKKVLVCGTPCQMYGLRAYLGNEEYGQLILVDFRCNGVISPKFTSAVLDYWSQEEKCDLEHVSFTNKEFGWRNRTIRLDFKNGKSFYRRQEREHLYSITYSSDVVTRPSCCNCKFKDLSHVSDITIGNYLNCDNSKIKNIDDNAGTSLVIINTRQGAEFFESVKPTLNCILTDVEDVLSERSACKQFRQASIAERKLFFNDLGRRSIDKVVNDYLSSKEKECEDTLGKELKMIIKSLRRGLYYSRWHPFVFIKFLYYNTLCKAVKSKWKRGALLYITPSATIEIHKEAKLILDGYVIVGSSKLRKTKSETLFLIESGGVLHVKGFFKIFCGNDIEILRGATMDIDEAGTNLGCTIICANKISLNGIVAIGRNVSIRDTNAHLVAMDGYEVTRPVRIEDHVWLCSGCTINPGVTIHSGAIVGACAFVLSSVPAHSIVAGNPARTIMSHIEWKLSYGLCDESLG